MLKISMESFLAGNPLDTTLEQRVLALELLAYNFHDTLLENSVYDLAPSGGLVVVDLDGDEEPERSGDIDALPGPDENGCPGNDRESPLPESDDQADPANEP